MARMTDEEADYWDNYFTKNPPKVTGEGKGFFVKHRGNVVILDDLSAAYLHARAEGSHKSITEIIGEMVREKITAGAEIVWNIDFSRPLNYHWRMIIEQTIEIPANRRITLEVPREIPEGRVVLTFTPASPNPFAVRKAKSKAARQRLRELCKDSPLTVESFLAMKDADRVLEAVIDKHSGSNVQ